VDSGYLTQEVYHNVRKYRYLHWFAIKGQSGDKPLVSTPSTQEINYKGEKNKRGIQLYKIGVDLAKETLYSRSNIETPGAKYLNFPNNLESNWYEGFCGEVQVTKHQNGRPYMTWEKLAGVRNEPLDTFVYALAAAHLVGITRLNWQAIELELMDGIVNDQENGNPDQPSKETLTTNSKRKNRRSTATKENFTSNIY
jgi:phage terminase large subunit GpA-like protein